MSSERSRRRFLRDGTLVVFGAAGATVLPPLLRNVFKLELASGADPAQDSAEKRLRELGIELPPAPKPVAVYVPAVRVGNMLYASGHGPRNADGTMVRGKVGGELSLEQGYAAARLVGLNMLSTVRNTLGSLDKVARLVKVLGLVYAVPDFAQQPQVVNGFSELMVEVFGESAGKAARSAVGAGSLPGNIPVEIEAIFALRD